MIQRLQKNVGFGRQYQEMVAELEKEHPEWKRLNDSQKYIRIFEAGYRALKEDNSDFQFAPSDMAMISG